MLSVIEKFVEPIRRVSSDAEARTVLRQIADQFGFRSAFLIEYEPDFSAARHLIDTYPERAAHWAELFRSKGFAPGVKGIQTLLAMDMVVKTPPDRFEPDHPYRDFAHAYDLLTQIAVPISQSEHIAGLVSYSGTPKLAKSDEIALQLVSYSLFTQLRSIEVAEKPLSRLPGLTPREKQVMALSADGLTSVEIAGQLGMSPRTVNQHVDNVAEKLGTRNRTHTIAELLRHDMLN